MSPCDRTPEKPSAIPVLLQEGGKERASRSSRFERLEEVGTHFFQDVYCSRGTLPPKRHGKKALLGDLVLPSCWAGAKMMGDSDDLDKETKMTPTRFVECAV